jgi:ABC-type branched-subunit amino acid transport system permease subunit
VTSATRRSAFLWTGLLVAVGFSGAFAGDYVLYLMSLAGVAVIVSLGLDVLMGVAGLISLGQAAFYGIGAYTSALLMARGLPFPACLLAGGLVAAAIGILVGLPALRVRGHYLALITLAFGEVARLVFLHWQAITGGASGLPVARPVFYAWISRDLGYFYVILLVATVLGWLMRNVRSSRPGRALIALGDSEIASRCCGLSTIQWKLVAWGVSTFYAGVAGALFGPLIGFIDPASFTLITSLMMVMMIVLGGRGTLAGAVLGAVIVTLLPEMLRTAKDLQFMAFAVILGGSALFLPDGLWGLARALAVHVQRAAKWRAVGG